MLLNDNNNSNFIFIHANGYPPKAYKCLHDKIDKKYNLYNYLLRPLWDTKEDPNQLKDWNLFQNDFLDFLELKNEKYIGIGHSIGGNLILRTAISNPEYFNKIILLDPTLFIPRIIYMWKLAIALNLQNKFHPWIVSTLNRKMTYKSYKDIFNSYRNKSVFSKINDKNLTYYINSITKEIDNEIHITYSKKWEYQIYKTGLLGDMFIWKNINRLNIPCLILRAEDSNAFLNSSQAKIEKLNPKIKFKTIKESTHLFPLENPNKTFDNIESFLNY